MIGVLDKQIAVILVSTQNIKEGSELFYDYGDYYWLDNKELDMRKEELERLEDNEIEEIGMKDEHYEQFFYESESQR